MLDLSNINIVYELKWFDGQVLHLPKPTEAFLRKIAGLYVNDDLTDLETMEEAKKITYELLRKNTEGRKFTKAELEQCDGIVCSMILSDYMDEMEKRLGE